MAQDPQQTISELTHPFGEIGGLAGLLPLSDLIAYERALNQLQIATSRNADQQTALANAITQVSRTTSISRLEMTKLSTDYATSLGNINLRIQSFINLSQTASRIDPFNAGDRVRALLKYSETYGGIVDRIFATSRTEEDRIKATNEAFRLREVAIATGDRQMAAFIEATIRGTSAEETFATQIHKVGKELENAKVHMADFATSSSLVHGGLKLVGTQAGASIFDIATLVGALGTLGTLGKKFFGHGGGGGAAHPTGIPVVRNNILPEEAMMEMSEDARLAKALEIRGAGAKMGALRGLKAGGIFTLVSAGLSLADILTTPKGEDRRTIATGRATGSFLGGTLGVAAGGAVTGAAIGSIFPGAGTAAGAIIGTIVGGIAGSSAGGAAGEKFTTNLVKAHEPLEKFTERLHKASEAVKSLDSFAESARGAAANINLVRLEFSNPFTKEGSRRTLIGARGEFIQSAIGLGVTTPQMSIQNTLQMVQSLRDELTKVHNAPINMRSQDELKQAREAIAERVTGAKNVAEAFGILKGDPAKTEALRKELLGVRRERTPDQIEAAKNTRQTQEFQIRAQINDSIKIARRTFMEQMSGAAMNLPTGTFTMPSMLSDRSIFGSGFIEGGFQKLTPEEIKKRSRQPTFSTMQGLLASDIQNPIAKDIETAINGGKVEEHLAGIDKNIETIANGTSVGGGSVASDTSQKSVIRSQLNAAKQHESELKTQANRMRAVGANWMPVWKDFQKAHEQTELLKKQLDELKKHTKNQEDQAKIVISGDN